MEEEGVDEEAVDTEEDDDDAQEEELEEEEEASLFFDFLPPNGVNITNKRSLSENAHFKIIL